MSLRTTTSSLRQQWGEALAQWLMNSAPQLDRLVTARDVLLQITLPVGTRTDAPAPRARVQSPAGAFASATFICEAPHTDPRLQGRSFFYQADAHDSGLRPGMSVTAYLSAPSELAGVLVPQSAIVWWQGKAWLYLQRDAEHFERREIVLDTPVDGDWFVTERIQPGQRVVVAGAQLLLSEELRAQMGSAEEEQE
jgi:multidrug efflux pump subunit AcrA (membrane-fusion protein)